ncbi:MULTISPECIES: hypothetical protein [unclassified Leucobacter]|uniref:hypothetical protein n=1 Tax=unclassified Leucobacter TaxID=2621730 RepID=UPI003015CEE5
MTGTTLTREAELSLQLHSAALPFLRQDWPTARRLMRSNLALLKRRRRAPLAEGWVREWETAVEAGPEAVAAVALTEGERGIDLRQVSPLAGVLPQHVRLQVLKQVRGHAAH